MKTVKLLLIVTALLFNACSASDDAPRNQLSAAERACKDRGGWCQYGDLACGKTAECICRDGGPEDCSQFPFTASVVATARCTTTSASPGSRAPTRRAPGAAANRPTRRRAGGCAAMRKTRPASSSGRIARSPRPTNARTSRTARPATACSSKPGAPARWSTADRLLSATRYFELQCVEVLADSVTLGGWGR